MVANDAQPGRYVLRRPPTWGGYDYNPGAGVGDAVQVIDVSTPSLCDGWTMQTVTGVWYIDPICFVQPFDTPEAVEEWLAG